jgi:hypothetical protein
MNEHNLAKSTIPLDTTNIAVIVFDTINIGECKGCKAAFLTKNDLTKIEVILNRCINDYNPQQVKLYNEITFKKAKSGIDIKNFTIDLSRYKRQYIAFINIKGEKEVWVNCFCGTWDKDWRKEIIFVHDGGNCYFNLKVNLTKHQYSDLMVNGDV